MEVLKRQIIQLIWEVQEVRPASEWSRTREEARSDLDDEELMEFAGIHGEFVVPYVVQSTEPKGEDITEENFDRLLSQIANGSIATLFRHYARRRTWW